MKAVATIDVLRFARSLISEPSTWTDGSFARDMNGNRVSVWSKDACQFCLLGSIRFGMYRRGLPSSLDHAPCGPQLLKSLDRLAKRHGYRFASDANDRGGHAVALAILDDAIAELEAKESK